MGFCDESYSSQEALSEAFVWRLKSVWSFCLFICLSVAYIGPNSRTERPRKTKIWHRGIAHVTWLRHRFQGKKVKGQSHQAALFGCPGRPTWTYSNGDLSIVLYMTYIVSPLQAWAEVYRGVHPLTACLTYRNKINVFKLYLISWVNQNLSSRMFKTYKVSAKITVSSKLFHTEVSNSTGNWCK